MIVEVNHLTKKYGEHTAVSDLSFTIEKGKVYGFLGPNGAGKSTTMNIMTGCLAATEGEIKIGGFDIYENPVEAKKLIGYLPEIPPLYQDRTPREYLTFVAGAKGISKGNIKEAIENVMEETKISDVADRLIRNLSKGYKQRVGIAEAIIGDPELIILDEPTVGLDPKQIIEIRSLIKKLGEKHTVILSSHILSEVQAVCDTIMIISKGKLLACDSPENLESLFEGKHKVDLEVIGDEKKLREALGDVGGIDKITIAEKEDSIVSASLEAKGKTDKTEICKAIFYACSKNNLPIIQMNNMKASLEEIFIELTTKEESEDLAEPQIEAAPKGKSEVNE